MKILNVSLNVLFGSLSVLTLSMLGYAVCTMIINLV
jgi:hypothetical protein